jgi:shikimate kinase
VSLYLWIESALVSYLHESLTGLNLYLIGMMGSGKTTVGKHLATHLGYRFVDTDSLVERVAGQSIQTIFESQGEEVFRQLEGQVLAEVSAYAYQKLAIATGGGIILRRENWSYLHHGLVIWLDVPVSVLCQRLKQDTTRPLLQAHEVEAKLQTLLDQRQSLYAQADVRVAVQAGHTAEQVVHQILDALPLVLKSHCQPTLQDNAQDVN